MKYIYLAIISIFSFFKTAHAQCDGGRFYDKVFSNITIDSAVYSSPYNLKMDIYQPVGDTMAHRPVIILAHEGAFIIGNRKDDNTIVQLCTDFAQRGYVTASIDYRLGSLLQMADSNYAVDAVTKAIGDGKAAIRYLVKDAATSNTYKVDTNLIFAGGNSAGSVLYLHVGYLDSLQEAPAFFQIAMNNNGGFDGNSGNPGYSSRLKGVINLAGGLNSASLISQDNVPSVNAQGDLDQTVPYNCAYALNGLIPVTLCGLGVMEPQYQNKNINHTSMVFTGDGHVPWDGNATKYQQVDSLIKNFLFQFTCPGIASINGTNLNAPKTNIYPNPASHQITISSSKSMSHINIYDKLGRTVLQESVPNSKEALVLLPRDLTSGLYFLKIDFDNGLLPEIQKLLVN